MPKHVGVKKEIIILNVDSDVLCSENTRRLLWRMLSYTYLLYTLAFPK
jgi:hypothetical protein